MEDLLVLRGASCSHERTAELSEGAAWDIDVRKPPPCTEYSSLPPQAVLVLEAAICINEATPVPTPELASAALYHLPHPEGLSGPGNNTRCNSSHRAKAWNLPDAMLHRHLTTTHKVKSQKFRWDLSSVGRAQH